MGRIEPLASVELGQRICIVGRGTANSVHAHVRVKRITKTMVVVGYEVKGRPLERRYRLGGREVGASEYGGSYADVKCQRPKA